MPLSPPAGKKRGSPAVRTLTSPARSTGRAGPRNTTRATWY